jgi:hypothetical protein
MFGVLASSTKAPGLPLMRESETSCFLKMGDEFLTLFKNERPGLITIASPSTIQAGRGDE